MVLSPQKPVFNLTVIQGHGQLDKIYADLEIQCLAKGWTTKDLDFLMICGDFQAVRNEQDLNCMSVPRKYRHLGDFHRYYAGDVEAPVLTIIIGGNHEASNYFSELEYGGWLAPNIYYLGTVGVVRYGPWRIGGLSGIYYEGDYLKPQLERLPYRNNMIKSVYHVRESNVAKLKKLATTDGFGAPDIFMTHDWPQWVELFGDFERLYRENPHFFSSAKSNRLGSTPAKELLGQLRPLYWFSGHMHVRFAATVEHTKAEIDETLRSLPVPLDMKTNLPIFQNTASDGQLRLNTATPSSTTPSTQFLALSKVTPRAALYLEVLELDLQSSIGEGETYPKDKDGKYALCYDEEWLALMRANDSSLKEQSLWVRENIVSKGLLRIPKNFVPHAPTQAPFIQHQSQADKDRQPPEYPNQQTIDFCRLLQLSNT